VSKVRASVVLAVAVAVVVVVVGIFIVGFAPHIHVWCRGDSRGFSELCGSCMFLSVCFLHYGGDVPPCMKPVVAFGYVSVGFGACSSPVLPQSDTSAGAGSASVRHAPVPVPPWRQTGESSAGVVDDGGEDDLLGAESGEEEGEGPEGPEGPMVSATEVAKAAIPSYFKPGTDPEKSAPSFLDQVPIPFVVVATVSLLLLFVAAAAAAAVSVATNVTARCYRRCGCPYARLWCCSMHK
jgi:hypothetical protein